jgi:RNA polymerase sigma-54 factor
MALRPKLELRQTQQLAMTPQLRQAIRMLQMSTVELDAFLAHEIERNPLIEIDGGGEIAAPAAPAGGERTAVDVAIHRADGIDAALGPPDETLRANLYASAERDPRAGPRGAAPRADAGDWDGDAAATVGETVTLARHVVAQLALARLSPIERMAAEALAGDLDEAGYLREPLDEAAARLGAPRAAVERAAAAIRACEPTGVGARSLAECLALQLAERGRLDRPMADLLDNLEALPTLPAATLARRIGVAPDRLGAMLAELRTLDPRPGLRVGGGLAAPARPDVQVSPDGAGGWRVELCADAAPRLRIDRDYARRVGADRRGDARAFVAECRQSAAWLARALEQRSANILKVAREIVRVQAGFLERGVGALRPLALREVAVAVGVHESTVSRVSANKFMETPRGLFELRYFFSAALAGGDGERSVSAHAVRGRIRELVSAEPAGRPLSDDQLVRALAVEGVDVARRTVAKYRESLGIPSSFERRRRADAAI